MPIERISASDFATMIGSGITDRDRTMDVNIGPIKDLRIQPFAEVLEFQNNRVVYLSELTSLVNADKLVPDDLDKIAFNESIIRWDGSSSTAIVTFSRGQPPTVDIPVPVNLPLATAADPKTGRSVMFRTIESATMFAASPTAYYNSGTDRYELNVAVASLVVGEETAVGAYTINTMRRNVPGFDNVENKLATTSGKAVETNQELADRILLHIEGSQLGTPAGNKSYILDNFSVVDDNYVVYGNDAYLTREQDDAGAIDIWVKGSSPLTRIYTTGYPGVETLMVLDRQPLISIISVISGATTFVEGTDFEIVSDTGAYARSNRGQDGIKFLTTAANVPASIGASVTITYQYNSLINSLVSFFTQSYYYSVGMDKVFKWAYELSVELDADLKVSGGNPDTILASIRTAISDYINALKLGVNVEEFDIDREVAKVNGVDNFTYNTLAVVDGVGVGDIEVPPTSYAQIADTDLVINLV